MIKKLEKREVSFDQVTPNPQNARVIADSARASLELSLDRFGYVDPIIWNEDTGHIVGGHQRFDILKSIGLSSADMVVVNMTESEELEACLVLNNPYIEGVWDDPIVELLDQLDTDDDQLFRGLGMDKLEKALTKKFDNVEKPEEEGIDTDGNKGDGGEFPEGDTHVSFDTGAGDTCCPCCAHSWDIEASDVQVMEGEDS